MATLARLRGTVTSIASGDSWSWPSLTVGVPLCPPKVIHDGVDDVKDPITLVWRARAIPAYGSDVFITISQEEAEE